MPQTLSQPFIVIVSVTWTWSMRPLYKSRLCFIGVLRLAYIKSLVSDQSIIFPNEKLSHALTYFKINITIVVCVELRKDLVHKHGGLRY